MEAASSSWNRASVSPPRREERRSGDRDLLAMTDRRPVESYGDRRRQKNSDKHDRANDHLMLLRGEKSQGDGSMRRRFNQKNESDQGWSHGGRGGDYSQKSFSQTNEGDRGWSGKTGKERSTEMGGSSYDRSSNAESVGRLRRIGNGRNWGGEKAEGSARNGGISASSSGRQWGKYKDDRWKDEDKKEDTVHKNETLSDRLSKRDRASAREEREDSGFEDDSDARERRVQRLKRRRRSAGLNSSEDERSPERTREGRWQSPLSVSATTPDRAARGRDPRWRNSSRAEEPRGREAFKAREERYGRRTKEESRSSAARDSSWRNEDDRWRHGSMNRRRHDSSQETESQRKDMDAVTADRKEDGNRSSSQHPESRRDRHEQSEDETHRYRQSHRSSTHIESRRRRSKDVEDDGQQWSEGDIRRRDGNDGRRGSQNRGYRHEGNRSSSKPFSTGRYGNARHDRSDDERDERHKHRGNQAKNASQSTSRSQRSMKYQDEKGRGLQRDIHRDRRRSQSPSARHIPSPHIDHNEERSWTTRDRRYPNQDRREIGRYSGAHKGDITSGMDEYYHERETSSDQRLAGPEETLRVQGRKEEDIAPSSAMQAAMEASLGVPSEILRPEKDDMDDRGSLILDTHSSTFLPVLRARPDEVYEQVAQVGEGTYGQVFKARGDRSGVIVALKKIRMESEKDGFPITAMREIKLLQSLRHDNIVRLHEMLLSKNSVYMVFEYLQHDLNGILAQSSVRFGSAHLKSLAQQLLSGLAYLHHHSILHRDLKGSNLLLNSEGTLKLADFGLARRYNKRAQGNVDYTNRVVTLWYRPPELLFGETCYNDAIDIWGAGCIFLELFTRKPAFQGNDEIHQVQVLFEVLGPINTCNWPSVETLPWYDLVRPSSNGEGRSDQEANGASFSNLRTLFAEQVPSDALDVASALLCYDPAQRLSAVDALHLDYFARNLPRPEKPRSILAKVSGDWHEFESRQAKRTTTITSRATTQVDKGEASKEFAQASSSTSNVAMGPPEVQPSTSSHKSALNDNQGIYA